jgi:hypothetical protein
MGAQALTVNSTLMCPHGGSVNIISSNTKVKVDGAFAALSNDQFIIAGCPFSISGAPSPCLSVKWLVADMKTKAGNVATLGMNSTGLCMSGANAPQGPVTISNAQTKIKTS